MDDAERAAILEPLHDSRQALLRVVDRLTAAQSGNEPPTTARANPGSHWTFLKYSTAGPPKGVMKILRAPPWTGFPATVAFL